MIVIKNIEEFATAPKNDLTSYLERKFSSMVKEYGCTMADVGEVQVLYDLKELFQIYGDCPLHSFEVMETNSINRYSQSRQSRQVCNRL